MQRNHHIRLTQLFSAAHSSSQLKLQLEVLQGFWDVPDGQRNSGLARQLLTDGKILSTSFVRDDDGVGQLVDCGVGDAVRVVSVHRVLKRLFIA